MVKETAFNSDSSNVMEQAFGMVDHALATWAKSPFRPCPLRLAVEARAELLTVVSSTVLYKELYSMVVGLKLRQEYLRSSTSWFS